ncbi:MAG: NAD(P)-dependent oxidoreductase [Coriobacteriales bacterium]|jgi:3-hydroxyisobutyrate dehydrogenase|nr:NAD(P)-dependent oxidoreductase [Coriobacteriales bacterium]
MIAFVWQSDWDVVACSFARRLVAAGHEVTAYVKNGQAGGTGVPSSAVVAAGAPDVSAEGGAVMHAGAEATAAGVAAAAAAVVAQGVLPAEVRRVKTLAAALEGADAVITLLSTPQEVEDVYLGEGGILEAAAEASLLIDLSASSPRLAKELYALAAVHDHSFVEAPFEGAIDEAGVADAATGADATSAPAVPVAEIAIAGATHTLRIFTAGEPDNLAKALPVLRVLTPRVLDVGLPGSATTIKLASQIALAGALMGVVEALTFAMVSGVEAARALEIVSQGAAASAVAQAFGQRIIDEDFAFGHDLHLFFNELTCALDTADEMGLALPGLETAQQLYDLLVLVGGGKKGIHALALIYCDEVRCSEHGLNWDLAQRAMDVYERAGDGTYDDYEYDYDYDDDEDECDDPNCGHHHHHSYPDEEQPPSMGRFFSPN